MSAGLQSQPQLNEATYNFFSKNNLFIHHFLSSALIWRQGIVHDDKRQNDICQNDVQHQQNDIQQDDIHQKDIK